MYILHTGVCDYAVGAILTQEHNGTDTYPISLQTAYRHPETLGSHCKEAFAIVYALKNLRPYLQGAKFTIYTDHKPLRSVFTSEVKNSMLQRWVVVVSQFNSTSTPKGSYSAKTGDNDCNVNSSHYSLSNAGQCR